MNKLFAAVITAAFAVTAFAADVPSKKEEGKKAAAAASAASAPKPMASAPKK